jgi:hypothetical protein
MGYYINNLADGTELPASGKASFLIKQGGAELVHGIGLSFQPNLVCVVSNGSWEAAAYIFDRDEMRDFNQPDDLRRKWWLTVPEAAMLSGYKDGPHSRR